MIPVEGRPILTAAQMRAAEERMVAGGTSLATLMRRAGESVADATRRLSSGAEVLVLCGPGNNGGDGYVAAATLRAAGQPVRVAALGEPKNDLARAARAQWAGPVEPFDEAGAAPVCVDALFGIGMTRNLDERIDARLHVLRQHSRLLIAVDLPSGASADDGSMRGEIPYSDLTLALGALKPAHVLLPSAAHCGTVRLLDIGLDATSLVSIVSPNGPPIPSAWDHKFSRGMVAVVAGAMPGAAALAATAAARSGAGYVLLLGSTTDRLPHAVVRRRWAPEALADHRIKAAVIGPGLGRDDRARERLSAVLATDLPLVIDGDALALLDLDQLAQRKAWSILTPHRGEFDRLFGSGEGSLIDRAVTAAHRSAAVVVLKEAGAIIAHPDGRVRIRAGASSWLSTAGTGDVLAGITGAALACHGVPLRAAETGVWLHTEAARLAGTGFIADDLPNHLPAAIEASW